MPSPNVQTPTLQTSSLHDCLEPIMSDMHDMHHSNLQNDLITYGEQNSIMQMQGPPLSSNSSIVNI